MHGGLHRILYEFLAGEKCMLFPEAGFLGNQGGALYYDDRDLTLQNRIKFFYDRCATPSQQFWIEADKDSQFYAGYQAMFDASYGGVPIIKRQTFNFPIIRPMIELIGGHQRKNRKSLIAVPVRNGDEMTADQYTKLLLDWQRREKVLEKISDAFTGSLITGMNLMTLSLDFRDDPVSGDLKIDVSAYNQFMIDPFFRNMDFSDCTAIWKRTFQTREEIISLWPEKYTEIMKMTPCTAQDGKFSWMPENYSDAIANKFVYDEFYYRAYRKKKMVYDIETGEKTEYDGDSEFLHNVIKKHPQLEVLETDFPTVKLGIVVQGKVFYDDINSLNIDEYPVVPMLTYYMPELPYYEWRIQGLTRALRDPQAMFNRRKITEMDILESQRNSGIKMKSNALVDPESAFERGQGKPLVLKDNAQMTDVEILPAPQIPPSHFQLSESLLNLCNRIAGITEENQGIGSDDIAGVVQMMRQAAGQQSQERLFDQLDHSMYLLGSRALKVMQKNYTPGKVMQIIGEQPAPQFYNKAFGVYDVAVEDGINTATQRQMQFAQLFYLKQAGIPIPDESLIEAATLQNKKQLIDQITQAKQAQMQQAQAQSQMQQQQIQAEINMANARAQADQGLGVERQSRVAENQAAAIERQEKAKQEKDQALLNLVKALKELQGVDMAQLEKLLQLDDILRAKEQQDFNVSQSVDGGLAGMVNSNPSMNMASESRL
jgi:hypothetical protein